MNLEVLITTILNFLKNPLFLALFPAILTIIFIVIWDTRREKSQRQKYLKDLLEEMEFNNSIAKDNWKRWREFRTLAYTDARSAKYLIDLPKELQEKIYKSYSIIINLHNRQIEPLEGNIMEVFKILDLQNTIKDFRKYLKKN